MEKIDFLRDVETRLPLEKLRCKNKQVWPFLRQLYFWQLLRKNHLGNQHARIQWHKEARRLLHLFDGFSKAGNRPYLILSSTDKRRQLGEQGYVDRVAHWLTMELGKNQCLFLVQSTSSSPDTFYQTQSEQDQCITSNFFHLFGLLPGVPQPVVEEVGLLKTIEQEYGLRVHYAKALVAQHRLHNLFTFYLKKWGTRCVFSTCYYGLVNQALIGAAHGLNIPVVELQHGAINATHGGFHLFTPFERTFLPDWLLCDGDHVSELFVPPNHFIDRNQVMVVGNAFMEALYEKEAAKQTKESLNPGYRLVVGVTLQELMEKELLEFIGQAAEKLSDIYFMIIPRNRGKDYSSWSLPENVHIEKQRQFYDLAAGMDVHTTIFSTCALECPALGTPNLLANIKGKSRWYFGDTLTDPTVTRFTDSVDEYIAALHEYTPAPSEEIRRLHAGIYRPGYQKNIQHALRRILPKGV